VDEVGKIGEQKQGAAGKSGGNSRKKDSTDDNKALGRETDSVESAS
jgi:hypothetical protein